ncbi:gp53-like domain-containing protein [Escherichia coli]|uniref:gp53-like domain-containing protein n=1 Tax=Escherichia coli TaxID=562 RepID=UPI003D78FB93
MPAFEWVHVQLHQQKGMISLSPPTICNSALDLDSFRSMMSGNGYIYIPCIATTGNPVKLMLQWGTVATQKGADAGYALPFAFPYAGLFATGNRGTSGYNAAMNVRIASRTHISIQNWSPSGEGTEDCCFIALGY